jgi:hypothetical protein
MMCQRYNNMRLVSHAWEARVLPLYDARDGGNFTPFDQPLSATVFAPSRSNRHMAEVIRLNFAVPRRLQSNAEQMLNI